MQAWYLAAGVLAALTGVVHSVLGERLIFRRLKQAGLVPNMGAPPLRSAHIRILWASWHIGSVFGWAFAGVLVALALAPPGLPPAPWLIPSIVLANLGASILVLVGTRGRHPGWIALLLVAVFAWIGATPG